MATVSQETAAFTGRSGPCERAPLSWVASKLSGGLRLAVLVSAVLLNGCAQSPAPVLSEPPSASISPADLADAIRFRTSSGLRADEAWIVAVAADPRSADGAREYGVPLLPDELVELARRAANSDAIFDVVESYGERHPADFGGLFVDNAGDGAVVALFSRNLAVHEAALRLLVNPKAALEVRPVRWSLGELDAFKAKLDADTSWLVPLGGAFVRSQVVPERNTVELRVSSASPDIVTVVTRHYGADGWLTVISDGIGPWTGGRGDLIVRVKVPAGMTPERSYACSLHPDDPAAYGDPGVEVDTDANRECRYEQIGATGYRVEIAGDAGRLLGTSRATVSVGRTVTVDVLLAEP